MTSGVEIINALLKPLGTNLNNYERRWHEEVIQIANGMAQDRADMLAVLKEISYHADNQDMSHLDFRVLMAEAARDVIAKAVQP